MPPSADPIAAINASFKLDDGSATPVLTDISQYLDSIEPSEDADELDGSTFQRPKYMIPGAVNMGLSLSGKWTAAAHTFFVGVKQKKGLAYEYGPEGDAAGLTKISGTCAVRSYSGPSSTQDGVTTFSAELSVHTQEHGVFP